MSSSEWGTRRITILGFTGLQLPAGLEFVDELDTATGDWER